MAWSGFSSVGLMGEGKEAGWTGKEWLRVGLAGDLLPPGPMGALEQGS